MRLVFLDSGPLGLLTNPRGRPKSDQCRQWVKDLAAAGVRVFVPEIADYEVRRKLIPIQASAGLRRLDQVKATLDYAPVTTDAMPRAAELWAAARSAGLPTAGPDANESTRVWKPHRDLSSPRDPRLKQPGPPATGATRDKR
jgi:hypothetical protein